MPPGWAMLEKFHGWNAIGGSMKKYVVACLGFALVLGVAWGIDRSPFLFRADLKGMNSPGNFVQVPVNKDVFAGTTNGFADLRLFDDQGKETPFVVMDTTLPEQPVEFFNFKIVSYQQASGTETLIVENPVSPPTCWEMDIRTANRDFNKMIRIEARNDTVDGGGLVTETWRDIFSDSIFDFSSRINVRKTSIKFPETTAKFFRISYQDVSPDSGGDKNMRLQYDGLDFSVSGHQTSPMKIDAITGLGGKKRPAEVQKDFLGFSNPVATNDKAGNTLLKLGRVNLPIEQMTFVVDNPYFYRQVDVFTAEVDEDIKYVSCGGGGIYQFPGMRKSETTLSLHLPQRKYVQIRIINGDNPPLTIRNIEINWVRQNLFFIPEANRNYAFFFGGENIRRPSYELANLLPSREALRNSPVMEIQSIAPNNAYAPQKPEDPSAREKTEKTILTIIIISAVLLMGLWIFQLMKNLPPPPPLDDTKKSA